MIRAKYDTRNWAKHL